MNKMLLQCTSWRQLSWALTVTWIPTPRQGTHPIVLLQPNMISHHNMVSQPKTVLHPNMVLHHNLVS